MKRGNGSAHPAIGNIQNGGGLSVPAKFELEIYIVEDKGRETLLVFSPLGYLVLHRN